MAKINEKQKRFADEYLIDLNATQAAIRAGYSAKTAEAAASRLLRNVNVSAYLQKKRDKLQDKTGITQERVLEEFAKIGFASITDYLEYKTMMREVGQSKGGDPIYDWAMSVIAKDSNEVDGSPIQEISIGRDGTFKFKMYSKLDALEKLGRHLGMFEKQDGGEGPDKLNSRIEAMLTGLKKPAPNRTISEVDGDDE